MYTKILRTLCPLYGKRVHKAQTIFKLIIFYISIYVNSLQSFHILLTKFLAQCTHTQHIFCTFCSPAQEADFRVYERNMNKTSDLIAFPIVHLYNSNSSRCFHIFGLSFSLTSAAGEAPPGPLINSLFKVY